MGGSCDSVVLVSHHPLGPAVYAARRPANMDAKRNGVSRGVLVSLRTVAGMAFLQTENRRCQDDTATAWNFKGACAFRSSEFPARCISGMTRFLRGNVLRVTSPHEAVR